jgi:hypothetical protein
LKGTLETWTRFTEEFAPGGLIATSTGGERDLAAMPTTNDTNEGMLGMWRRYSHDKLSLTAGHFSDQAMFNRNGTQDFMGRCSLMKITNTYVEKGEELTRVELRDSNTKLQ